MQRFGPDDELVITRIAFRRVPVNWLAQALRVQACGTVAKSDEIMDSRLNVQLVPLSTTPAHLRESTPSLHSHEWTASLFDMVATGKASRPGDHATFTGTRGISKQVG